MITKLNKHDNHAVKIHLTKEGSKHHAALRCVKCNKHIQWLGQIETRILIDLGISVQDNKFKEIF